MSVGAQRRGARRSVRGSSRGYCAASWRKAHGAVSMETGGLFVTVVGSKETTNVTSSEVLRADEVENVQ